MDDKQTTIGRAKTVLTFSEGDRTKAVISAIVAQVGTPSAASRITVTGTVGFHKTTLEHINAVILPLLDAIGRMLQLPAPGFNLAAVNLGAASVQDVGVQISGLSADVPIFIAMLSTMLELPVPQDLVATGHLAGPDGHIAMVRAIPAKLKAALHEKTVRTFLYPDWKKDRSLETLTPGEVHSLATALLEIQNHLNLVTVRDIGEVIVAVFSEPELLSSGLRLGYFDSPATALSQDPVLSSVGRPLVENLETRFWNCLEQLFLTGKHRSAKQLLGERIAFQIRKKSYPGDFGTRLRGLLRSLPPLRRQFKGFMNLISMRYFHRFSRYARPRDEEDVKNLFEALFGIVKGQPRAACAVAPPVDGDRCSIADQTLEAILSQISREALTQKIGLPIDTARACYTLDTVTVGSYEDFKATVTGYYLHLLRHYHGLSALPNGDIGTSDAYDLLERSFAKLGGSAAARLEAQDGTRGGMRFICDCMTDQFKRDEQGKLLLRVFKDALDPMDGAAKVALVQSLLIRLAPHLPEDLRKKTPAELARNYEILIRAYAESMDTIQRLLRSF